MPGAVGTWHWVATYNGDANNMTASSGCTAESVTVTQAAPTIATTPTPSSVVVGGSITDTATVSGGHSPTGTVTFNLFAPGNATCTGTPAFTSTNPLAVTPPFTSTSGPFVPGAVGTWHWVATYNGDANNMTASSGCTAESVTVTQAAPTIATTPTPSSVVVGGSITDTATVSGGFNPTGTVTFNLFAPGNATCTGTPAFTSTNPLAVTPPFTSTSGPFVPGAVGTWHWVATYNGDANNMTASSGCTAESVTVTQAAPTIATTPTPSSVVVGGSITDTATVSGGHSPTGTVTFNLFAPGNATCTGTPVSTSTIALSGTPPTSTSDPFTTAAVGTYQWVATYNGDANNMAASSVCGDEPVTVTQATPTIVTTATPGGPAGTTSITDTATVNGGHSPTGTVTFRLFAPGDATCTGTPVSTSTIALSGTPPTSTSDPFVPGAAGTYHWVATYNGDANNMAISSACGAEPVTIAQAAPTITTTPTPGGPVGTSISDTATVSGGSGPTGTVTFNLFAPGNTTCTGTPVFSSTNPLAVTPPFTSTSTPFPTAAVGTYHWVATYNGDANNMTASSGCTAEPVTIAQAAPTIATTATPGGPAGTTSITDTATVSGGFNPTGTVTFNLFAPGNATCTGTPEFTSTNPLSATMPFTSTSGPFVPGAVGTWHWVATYNGDANNMTASSGCTAEPVTITQAVPAITTTPTPSSVVVGGSITDTATVSGGASPTGMVTFNLFAPGNATCTGTPVSTSTIALSGNPPTSTSDPFTTAAVGTYQWVATYNGDDNNMPASSGCTAEPVTIAQAAPIIATSASPGGPVGTSISDMATVSGGSGPTGTVTFILFPPGNTTCTGDPAFTSTNPLSATMPFSATSTAFLPGAPGTYHWVATYNGDANNAMVSSGCMAEPVTIQATSSVATQVNMAGTTTALTGPIILGNSVYDTATVSHSSELTPTGTVTYTFFTNGVCSGTGSPVSTVKLTATGTVPNSTTVTPSAVNTFSFRAAYSGDVNFLASQSPCEPFVVDPVPPAPPAPITPVSVPVTG